jgi:hypothetical protein
VEALLASEHAGPMQDTRAVMALTSVRTLTPELVLADARMTVEGIRPADGKTLPPMPMQAVRPYAFLGGF